MYRSNVSETEKGRNWQVLAMTAASATVLMYTHRKQLDPIQELWSYESEFALPNKRWCLELEEHLTSVFRKFVRE